MTVFRLIGLALMGGGVGLGATAMTGVVLWLGLSVLFSEAELLFPGLVVGMVALPVAFCLGAAATLYAHLSPRWQPDPLPTQLLTYAVPPASLLLAAAWAAVEA